MPEASRSMASGDRRPSWIPAALLAAAAIACYAATIGYGFAYDDRQLPMSPLLARPFDFLAVLRNEYYPPKLEYIALYRPLAQWSLLVNWGLNAALFGRGDVAWTFHAVNVLLHALASVLAFVWLTRLGIHRTASLVAALLFAVLPIHSEAVANVTGRSEPQAFVLGLLFLLAVRSGRTIVAALCFLGALWSKESAIAFLPIAIVADLLVLGTESDRGRLQWKRFAPSTFVLVAWLVLRAITLGGAHPKIAFADNPVASASALVRVLTACAVQLRYLGLELLPIAQSPDYAYAEIVPVERVLDPRVLGFVVLAAVAGLAAFAWRRRAPFVALCVLGYTLAFSTTSNFVFPIGTLLAERLAYLPSLFVCVLLALGIDLLAKHRAVVVALAVVLLCSAGTFATVRQNRIWRDEPTFVREAVRAAPRSAKTHRNLGVTLEEEGDLEGAERELAFSASIYPGYGQTWFSLATVRIKLRDYEGALAALRSTIERMPDHVDAWVNLAQISIGLGRRADAVAAVREILKYDLAQKRLGELQDRLAATASPEDRSRALEDLSAAERALDAGDARSALPLAQRAVADCALPRPDRARGYDALARCWEALAEPARARAFREVAAGLRDG
jgi:tetratricopeptide (TPR) repeat protein